MRSSVLLWFVASLSYSDLRLRGWLGVNQLAGVKTPVTCDEIVTSCLVSLRVSLRCPVPMGSGAQDPADCVPLISLGVFIAVVVSLVICFSCIPFLVSLPALPHDVFLLVPLRDSRRLLPWAQMAFVTFLVCSSERDLLIHEYSFRFVRFCCRFIFLIDD